MRKSKVVTSNRKKAMVAYQSTASHLSLKVMNYATLARVGLAMLTQANTPTVVSFISH